MVSKDAQLVSEAVNTSHHRNQSERLSRHSSLDGGMTGNKPPVHPIDISQDNIIREVPGEDSPKVKVLKTGGTLFDRVPTSPVSSRSKTKQDYGNIFKRAATTKKQQQVSLIQATALPSQLQSRNTLTASAETSILSNKKAPAGKVSRQSSSVQRKRWEIDPKQTQAVITTRSSLNTPLLGPNERGGQRGQNDMQRSMEVLGPTCKLLELHQQQQSSAKQSAQQPSVASITMRTPDLQSYKTLIVSNQDCRVLPQQSSPNPPKNSYVRLSGGGNFASRRNTTLTKSQTLQTEHQVGHLPQSRRHLMTPTQMATNHAKN